MTASNISVYALKQKLSKVPENKLAEIDDFIESVLTKSKVHHKKITKFEGIWEGFGFEKINIYRRINNSCITTIVFLYSLFHILRNGNEIIDMS